jgi:hypothetical protein
VIDIVLFLVFDVTKLEMLVNLGLAVELKCVFPFFTPT